MKPRSLLRHGVIGAAGLLAAVSQASAANFGLFGDQSVTGAGVNGAGAAASAADASTIFFNPAGMGFLDAKFTITSGTGLILPDIRFTNRGSITAPGTPLQRLTNGPSGGNIGQPGKSFFGQSVPQLYLAYKINDRLALGFGVNAPFGLETNYAENHVLRYNATNSRVTDVNFQPTVSYKILPNLSLGAGLDISYLQVGLSSAIDYGLINASFANSVVNGVLNSATIPAALRGRVAAAAGGATVATIGSTTPGTQDGFVRFGGDAVGIGFNLGLLWEPIPGTRLGIAYRHDIPHDIEGSARFTFVPNYNAVPAAINAGVTAALTPIVGAPTAGALGAGVAANVTPGAAGLAARFVNNTPIKASLDLPASVSFSISQKISNTGFTVLGDVTWTRWTQVDQLLITNGNNGTTIAQAPFNNKDVFRYSIGGTYETGPWTFRGGYVYDNTPVPNSVFRSPRLPDADRQAIGVGFSYRWSERLQLSLSYNHLFFKDVRVNNVDPTGLHTAIGDYKTRAEVISFGSTMRFGVEGSVKRPEPKTVYTK